MELISITLEITRFYVLSIGLIWGLLSTVNQISFHDGEPSQNISFKS